MYRVSGDFAALGHLAAGLRRVASRELATAVNRRVAPEVVRLAREGAGATPYGAAWARRTDGGAATLSAVLETLRAAATGRLVRARVAHPGARIHQYGGTIRPKRAGGRLVFNVGGRTVFASKVTMPRRQYMPEADRGLPAPWLEAFGRAADAALRALLTP